MKTVDEVDPLDAALPLAATNVVGESISNLKFQILERLKGPP
jgi:hypothetical protein